nr:non-ribosomal peptide synthase/polyketide synthase [Chitinophaga sp. MD30]
MAVLHRQHLSSIPIPADDQTLATLFEAQVLRTGAAVAAVYGDHSITYAALNTAADDLAHYLQTSGIGVGSLVPVCMERSIGLLTGILAIVKTGAAYVPIDPEYPAERIRYMLETCKAPLLITHSNHQKLFSNIAASELLLIDRFESNVTKQPIVAVKRAITDLAYVIFTSGSTGLPKGVMVPHKGVINLVNWHQQAFSVDTASKATVVAGEGFDAMGWEIWPYLLAGATLYFIPDQLRLSMSHLAATIANMGITHSFLPTALVHEFIGSMQGRTAALKYLLTGGDKLSATAVNGLDYKVVNNYGPTENSVVATSYVLTDRDARHAPPIGTPINNVQVYVLNNAQQYCPAGVAGELYIGGIQLADGYLEQPALTAAAFIPDKFTGHPGAKLYRTGDIVKWNTQGQLEYVGRKDTQVKIRGYRIELGEITSVLLQYQPVKQAIVIDRTDNRNVKRLAAYIVTEETLDIAAVTTFLRSRLPDYMLPAWFISLDELPLTANGKIDVAALPNPGPLKDNTKQFVPPANETEQMLVNIWQELLGLEQIGVYDNFFELGGDSIITIQVVSRAKRAGYDLHPRDLFIRQHIKGLASLLDTRGSESNRGEQGLLTGVSGLLPIQQWYLGQLTDTPRHFNQSVVLNLDKRVPAGIVENAISTLVSRHDALRFSYKPTETGWQQTYGNDNHGWELVDLSHIAPALLGDAIVKHGNYYQRQVDISDGSMMIAVMINTPAAEKYNRLMLIIHHLAVDGVSWRILLEELNIILNNTGQENNGLLDKGYSYRQWHNALTNYSQLQRLKDQLPYWQQLVLTYQPLTTDKTSPATLTYADYGTIEAILDAQLTTDLLLHTSKAYRTDVNDLLLTALSLALSTWSGREKVYIGLEGHGREEIGVDVDSSRTVGWFTTLYPVALTMDANQTPGNQIKSVKEQLRKVADKGIGFGVLKHLLHSPSLQGQDPWDVVFNYLGQSDHILGQGELLSLAPETAGEDVDPLHSTTTRLALDSVVTRGQLMLTWRYSKHHYDQTTINNIANAFTHWLNILVDHCRSVKYNAPTPADFDLGAYMTYDELDAFLDEIDNGTPRRTQVSAVYRLSALQEGMLFHSLYDSESGTYVEQFNARLEKLDVPVFEESWRLLLQRHTILRTGFSYDRFSIPVQYVYREIPLLMHVHDLRQQPATACEAFKQKDRREPFNLNSAPLMRFNLLQTGDTTYECLWTFHHLLIDGWSIPVLIEELLSIYEALIHGKLPAAIEEDKYEDYIRYQQQQDKEKETSYWRTYMQGIEGGTLLPFIDATANRNTGEGIYEDLQLPLTLAESEIILQYSQQHHITLNTLMQGVWAYLLYRYTGKTHACYGVTVAGRPADLPQVEQRVGLYINTLPLHGHIQRTDKITAWLLQLQDEQLKSREYQYAALNEIKKWTAISGDLFDTLLVFENYPVSKVITAQPWALEIVAPALQEHTNYPLQVTVEQAQHIHVSFRYNQDLLKHHYVQAISGHFRNTLLQVANGADTWGDIDMLTPEENTQLLQHFNDVTTPYPADQTLVQLFEQQVQLRPDAIAISFGDTSLTYLAVDQQADRLAAWLRSQGVGKDVLVPLCIERSPEMIIAILGIVKAGGAYVPIDVTYPAERIAYLIEDTAAKVIVSSRKSRHCIPHDPQLQIITLEDEILLTTATGIKVPVPAPDDLAYVIFTSGSTGKPKGVMVEHKGMLNHLFAKINDLQLDHTSVIAYTASYTFDISVWQMFAALLCGGRTVIYTTDDILRPVALTASVDAEGVTILELVPSYLASLLHEEQTAVMQQLKYLLVTGEAVSQPLLAQWFGHPHYRHIPVVNAYGPTEASDDICHHIMYQAPDTQLVPLGKPIQNMRIYILDEAGALCPLGVAGEICVAGVGVSRGYLNRPELTAEKFIKDPFSNDQHSRLYRTGDLGTWLPDGTVAYFGRIDEQVKVRGYRIELGEIESILLQHEAVRETVVVAKADENGNKRLIAYVVAADTLDTVAVMTYLKGKMPEYMIPSWLIQLEKLPLTTNGKVDKKALPVPDMKNLADSYVAPRNDIERTLCRIWEELLHVSPVGISDNFFELGGDSIITIQLVSRAKRAGYNLHPRDIFRHQQISSLSSLLLTGNKAIITTEQGLLEGDSRLLPVQQHFFETVGVNADHYIQDVLLNVQKEITAEQLSTAIHELLRFHDALRFKYTFAADNWHQEYGQYTGSVEVVNLGTATPANYREQLLHQVHKYQLSLDITAGIVCRFVLFRTPAAEQYNRLLIVVHHLAVDGVSWRILTEDLNNLLKGQETLATQLKGTSYRQWRTALEQYGQRKSTWAQLPFWKKVTSAYQPLRTDNRYDMPVTTSDIILHETTIAETYTTRLLYDAGKAYNTGVEELLLTALALTLSAWNSRAVVNLGLEAHGREDIAPDVDSSRTIGWFTSLYPVMLTVKQDLTAADAIKSVKEQLGKITDKGIGYGVLKYINQEETLQGHQPWDVTFNYLGQIDNMLQQDTILSLAEETTGMSSEARINVPDKLMIDASVSNGKLIIQWRYSKHHFSVAGITDLSEHFNNHLIQLLDHCASQQQPVPTPMDFRLGDVISYEDLDKFLDTPFNGAPRRNQVNGLFRLSNLQEGMLFHTLYNPDSITYREQLSAELSLLDTGIFIRSWELLLDRFSILRSGFYVEDFSILVQCEYKKVPLPVTILDYSAMEEQQQQEAVRAYEQMDLQRGFDLENPPLMRISLIKTATAKYRLLWTYHHILLDGWSMPVLMEDLLDTYEALAAGKQVEVGPVDRYGDYIHYLGNLDGEATKTYWQQYLSTLTAPTLLPFIGNAIDRTRAAGKQEVATLTLDNQLTTAVNSFAQKAHITQNTLMQGIWTILLSKYSGRQDVTFGVTVSGRPEDMPGVEQRVGLYINTLPLHQYLDEQQHINDWLLQLQEAQLQSREHQYTALKDIQGWIGITGDLFDTLMVYENYPVNEVFNARHWQVKINDLRFHEQTNYPLSIIIAAADKIDIGFHYNSDLLQAYYVEQMLAHFKEILTQIISGTARQLRDIQVLTTAQQHQLLHTFNNTDAAYPEQETILSLFERQVKACQDNIALTFEDRTITYAELNRQASSLGSYLISKGVQPEQLIPICVDRSPEMIIGILGILKAGAAYVPIDPAYPEDRIAFILNDLAANILLTTQAYKTSFDQWFPAVEKILLDDHWQQIQAADPSITANILPHHLAYIIYTSGSTGQPKGVMIEHRNIVRLFETDRPLYDFNEKDVWSLFHSFCFDFSVWEMYGALFYGGKVVIVPGNITRDTAAFSELLHREGVTVLNQTPTAFYVLQDALIANTRSLQVRYVIFGGEALDPAKLKPWSQLYPHCRLVNMYGITETTVHVTYQELGDDQLNSRSLIGKPIPTLRVHILDNNGQLVPVGVAGEMYIAGAGLARGYLNRPELTALRFVPAIYGTDHTARWYRSGDLGRWLPDGTIEYLGRIDDQVKIRGYRIELGEIESKLAQCPSISQAVVLAKTDGAGNKQLVAYVVPKATFDKITVQSWLLERLPEYMVPALWIALESIPLTVNGKVDKKALPELDAQILATKAYVAPATPAEHTLVHIWQELLGIANIGVHDNFFELGGHSLLATRVVAAIRRELETDIAIRDLFTYNTVATLAARITEQERTVALPPVTSRAENAPAPLSFSQERLWFIDQLEGTVQYHIPIVARLKGKLDKKVLSRALQQLLQRHEALRTVIVTQGDTLLQQVKDNAGWEVQLINVPEYKKDEAALRQYIQNLISQPFDLQTDFLFRAHLIASGRSEHILVLTMHHIVSDGWSIGILVEELAALYNGLLNGQTDILPALSVQYADYAAWQRRHLGSVIDQQLSYWRQQLAGVTALQLPLDFPRPAIQSIRGAMLTTQLDHTLTARLKQLADKEGVSLYMTLLAAFKVLLYRYSGQEDVAVGSPISGRTRHEVEHLVGFFVNTITLRSHLKQEMTFTSLLQQMKETTLQAYEHQDVPFERIVEAVVKERDTSRNPLFQVAFALHNTPEIPALQLGDVQLTSYDAEHNTAKFDLTFSMVESDKGLDLDIEYCIDLFREDTIRRMAAHFYQLLLSITAAPATTIAQLNILGKEEQQLLAATFNNTAVDYPRDKNIVDLFSEQVQASPDAVAVIFEGSSLTYGELDKRADQLAHYLVQKGVTPETLIPVCLERSLELMVAILGILKAGAAYVPVDPDYPLSRIRYMLDDTAANIIITADNYRQQLTDIGSTVEWIYLDRLAATLEQWETKQPLPAADPGHLAYIMYTSGSTGQPKGVMVTHRNVTSLVKQPNYTTLTASDTILSAGSLSFDATTYEYWGMLLNGGKLLMMAEDTLLDTALLKKVLHEKEVTRMFFTTGWFNQLVETDITVFEKLSAVLTGGEKMSEKHVAVFRHTYPHIEISNIYGPTENTTFSLSYNINARGHKESTPIGIPLNNRQAYVLDALQQLVPVGIPGEIYVSGEGIARGYLNRAALTAEKFLPNPFVNTPDARMYRTGDLGRWLPDGSIEYLGRVDDQIKIRGFRIELGEIESTVEKSDMVTRAFVIVRKNKSDQPELIAYVLPAEHFDKGALLAFLRSNLPQYMVPALLVPVSYFPLNANGKIDKSALPEVKEDDLVQQQYIAPSTPAEKTLTAIWQELLGVSSIGIMDNFFELGGHSLLVTRVIAAIRNAFGIEVPVRIIFQLATIETLARYIEVSQEELSPVDEDSQTFRI